MNYSEITAPTEYHMIVALADIAGFARASQNLSNRELFDMLDEFYELIGGIVEDAGGKVVKFMGDGALIVFPEEMAKRAIEALGKIKMEANDWLSRFGLSCRIYLKAHIGSVICGPLGTAKEKHFDVIGDTVMKLFLSPSGDFVLSPELEQIVQAR
ncbi:MAG: adenylate/guanylate cyclase domain-containing protein [Candidatus Tectomicrobia bacterium]|nr:adenylate/guanylate cyclase domain-containing protein [Candidatus Tectomicrobia bacterium]